MHKYLQVKLLVLQKIYDISQISRYKPLSYYKYMKVHLTLVTWNLKIPLGSSFSSIIISTISIPGLRKLGCPAEKSEFTRYTLVMLTINPSSNSGASSWRWGRKEVRAMVFYFLMYIESALETWYFSVTNKSLSRGMRSSITHTERFLFTFEYIPTHNFRIFGDIQA